MIYFECKDKIWPRPDWVRDGEGGTSEEKKEGVEGEKERSKTYTKELFFFPWHRDHQEHLLAEDSQ